MKRFNPFLYFRVFIKIPGKLFRIINTRCDVYRLREILKRLKTLIRNSKNFFNLFSC